MSRTSRTVEENVKLIIIQLLVGRGVLNDVVQTAEPIVAYILNAEPTYIKQ